MKRIVVWMVLILFIAGAMPVFAADMPKKSMKNVEKEKSVKSGEKSLFQIATDTMDKPAQVAEKDKIKPIKKIALFQNCSNYIKESSKKAKNQSLRKK